MRQLTLQKEKLRLPALGLVLTWAVLPRQKKVMIEAWRSLTKCITWGKEEKKHYRHCQILWEVNVFLWFDFIMWKGRQISLLLLCLCYKGCLNVIGGKHPLSAKHHTWKLDLFLSPPPIQAEENNSRFEMWNQSWKMEMTKLPFSTEAFWSRELCRD